jgi:hypothetical protein
MREDVWKAQIRKTVEKHLVKELQVRKLALKVLSLFFIDRVANYRSYDDTGQPVAGKFAQEFEETLRTLAKEPRFSSLEWLKLPINSLHNGYFAQDKKGILKDTKGDTQADDDVYSLIMKDKERLLSTDERKRLTNTPVPVVVSVLRWLDDREKNVVSAQATHPRGSSATGGEVCGKRHATERVLPESGFELRHAESHL